MNSSLYEPTPSDSQGVKSFFESLGYEVTWDYNRRDAWWEIMDASGMICQIDTYVPLSAIKADMACFYAGKEEGTSTVEWECRGPQNERLEELFRKVSQSL